PSGQSLAVFLYDGPIARSVAFEGLLSSGEHFANRLTAGFSDAPGRPQLVHIATDGETYGHHHRHGEMALAYATQHIETNSPGISPTNYGEYLERHPPTHEVEIAENTSWSCVHGIERWRGDCGCHTGGRAGWNQAWRGPLRAALDALRDDLAPRFEEGARPFLGSPWAARDDYARVILDRSPESLERFFADHAARALGPGERTMALKWLELQRHAMLMYTSCGWFFNELSGIETVQVLQYAGRACQLARELVGDGTESAFLERLRAAKSNLPEHEDGARIYEKFVKPAIVDLPKVAAHFALSSLFEEYSEREHIYGYTVEREDDRRSETGRARLALGVARVTSEVTGESGRLSFGVLYFGDHNLNGGVREFQDEAATRRMIDELEAAFGAADFTEVIRLLDKHFGTHLYSLRTLFRDEQRRILHLLLEGALEEAESAYRHLYEDHAPLMRFVADLGNPLPKSFTMTAEFVLNTSLRRALEAETLDLERIETLLEEAGRWKVPLDAAGLRYALERTLDAMAEWLRDGAADPALLQALSATTDLVGRLPFDVDLWKLQNEYYDLCTTIYPEMRPKAERGDPEARAWLEAFVPLGAKLSVRVS
ncbi:MAG: DUF3536 domain-containing protein, partial [Gemmatimonadota bacterium]